MSVYSIFTSAPVFFEICKNLDNVDRSHLFRTCKSWEQRRSEPIYRKLFCTTLGMSSPFAGSDWPITYSKVKELFSAKEIRLKPIEGEKAIELSKLHKLKTLVAFMNTRSTIEGGTYFRIHEEEQGGAYYTSSRTLLYVSEDSNKSKIVLRKLTGMPDMSWAMTLLGNNDFGMVLVKKSPEERTLLIIDMHRFKCICSLTLPIQARGICSKGAQVFVIAETTYYKIEFKK